MTTIHNEDDPKLMFLPIQVATQPKGHILEHIANSYWICHPEKGLVFCRRRANVDRGASPQCNTNQKIVETFAKAYPWAEIKFVKHVFRPIHPIDYVS